MAVRNKRWDSYGGLLDTDESDSLSGPVRAVLAGALCLGAAAAGWQAGLNHANDQLPKCVEDEVLVAEDFPYTNTANLKCVHIEDVRP